MATIAYGSKYDFNTARSTYVASCMLDSTHFVVAYQVGSKGKAIIGTMSGNTISYGTEFEFSANAVVHISVSKISSTSFVIAYKDTTGKAIICSVSGTTISSGSELQFDAGTLDSCAVSVLDSTHFVVGYTIASGGAGYAIVGIYAGTTIASYGSRVQFESGSSSDVYPQSVKALDSTHFVLAFRDGNDSNKGTAIIGVVSVATIITFGSQYQYETVECLSPSIEIIDSTTFVLAYETSTKVKIRQCTVASGNQISYGTAYEAYSGTETAVVSLAMMNSTRFFIAYHNPDGKGKGIIAQNASGVFTFSAVAEFSATEVNYERSIGACGLDDTHVIIAYDASADTDGTGIVAVCSFTTNYPMVASQGSISLTGQNALLVYGHKLIAGLGSFVLTGYDVVFHQTLRMISGFGSFVLSGQNAILRHGQTMVASVGTFVLTGYDILLHIGRYMAGAYGAFTLTGQDATLRIAMRMQAGYETFILSGQSILFHLAWKMQAVYGSITLTGQDVLLKVGRYMAGAYGAFTLTGQSILFHLAWKLRAVYGSFVLSGQSIRFAVNGLYVQWFNTAKNATATMSNAVKNVSTWINQVKNQ